MTLRKSLLCLAFLLVPAVPLAEATSPVSSETQDSRSVWFSEIRGPITPASADYLQLSIRRAEQDQAIALVVELDTPGGLLASVRTMAQSIERSGVPVVVHVTPAGASATSAGALLMLASHQAAMSPGSAIGAAHPVGGSGEEIPGVAGEKATQDTAAFATSLAEWRGRNSEVARKMVTESLSLTASEAHRQKIIEILASDRTELLRQLDGRKVMVSHEGSGKVEVEIRTLGRGWRTSEMTPGQRLLTTLADPNSATLLMTLGILAVYVEISAPGFGLPGIFGILALLISFLSYQLLPIRTGGLLLLGLGIAFSIAEVFASTHGLLALGGAVSFILGALWVMNPAESSLSVSVWIWGPSAVLLGGGGALLAFFAARSRTLSKKTRETMGGETYSGLSGYFGKVESVSPDGRSGKTLIRGEVWDFVADTTVTPGDLIQVLSTEGLRAKVKRSPKTEEGI